MSVQEELTTKPPKSKWFIPFPIILVMVFSILSVLFFIPIPAFMKGKLGSAILNTGHIIFFCIFAIGFYRFTKGKNRTRIPRFLFIVFLLSVLVELLQSSVGRAFQWDDILRNILGTSGSGYCRRASGPPFGLWVESQALCCSVVGSR